MNAPLRVPTRTRTPLIRFSFVESLRCYRPNVSFNCSEKALDNAALQLAVRVVFALVHFHWGCPQVAAAKSFSLGCSCFFYGGTIFLITLHSSLVIRHLRMTNDQ